MAKARQVRSWTVYVDESGNFEDFQDHVAVAGLLLSDDATGVSPRALRTSLERAMPWFPWPLHASHVNQPAYVAIAWHQRFGGAPTTGDAAFAGAAREAMARMASKEAERLAALVAAFGAGKRLDISSLDVLRRLLLREWPKLARELETGTRQAWALVRDAARKLLVGPGSEAWLVSASETGLGDAGTTTDERYFGALEALLERVHAVLQLRGGDHKVAVRVLARDVFDLRIRHDVRLMPQHVGEVIWRLMSDGPSVVRLLCEEVADYDANVGIAFVFSDFFANRARRTLRDESRPLDSAERELAADLGVSPRSGDPSRSHLAATGDALRFLRGLVQTGGATAREQLPWTLPRRRWAVEQAWEWADRA